MSSIRTPDGSSENDPRQEESDPGRTRMLLWLTGTAAISAMTYLLGAHTGDTPRARQELETRLVREHDALWEKHRLYADDRLWNEREGWRFRRFELLIPEDRDALQPARTARFTLRLEELARLAADWEKHAQALRAAIAQCPPGQARLRWALQHRLTHVEGSLAGRFVMLKVLYETERDAPGPQDR